MRILICLLSDTKLPTFPYIAMPSPGQFNNGMNRLSFQRTITNMPNKLEGLVNLTGTKTQKLNLQTM